MTNEELLTELVRLHLGIDAIHNELAGRTDNTQLPPNLRRVERARRDLHQASAKTITATNVTQQWIYYTGGLDNPISSDCGQHPTR